MFITFLKRLVGADEESVETNERFNRGLNGLKERQQELTRAGEDLERLLHDIGEQQERIQESARSGWSGEHELSLPAEEHSGGQGEGG